MNIQLLSLRQHFWIGLSIGGLVLAGVFLLLLNKQRANEKYQENGKRVRPVYLAAMDPQSDLPDYLLTLCGPEILVVHGGKSDSGAMPDWFREAGRAIAAKGLAWPKPKIGLGDPILMSNVREHESRAVELLATDPAAAVAMIERLIRIEEQKFKTRSWRKVLAVSAESHEGQPEPGVYKDMLEDIPEQNFEMIIGETLEKHPNSELADIAITQALKRDQKLRMTGLAAVIRTSKLSFATREKAARALASELNLSFSADDVDGRDWTFEVGERLRADPSESALESNPPSSK